MKKTCLVLFILFCNTQIYSGAVPKGNNIYENLYLNFYYNPDIAEKQLDSTARSILLPHNKVFNGKISFLKAFILYQNGDIDASLNSIQDALNTLPPLNKVKWIARRYLFFSLEVLFISVLTVSINSHQGIKTANAVCWDSEMNSYPSLYGDAAYY
ncbi:hypothetical protein ACE01N_10050 [Saccharicrinis sp. FJH2]|uniref:hypothetical protein n=1 Tax=Saccharicrinis sp. FJH65 TaxID=3344659 RepID=UPI0035F48C48